MKKLFLGLITIALIGKSAYCQEASASIGKTIVVNEKNGVQRWKTSTPTSDFNIELRGKIELTDDDKDIKSISDDGYLEINKTVFGSKRTVIIESQGGGKVKKEYYEGRTKMGWENGKAWLGEILPELVRSSTIGAEDRVNRFYIKGGTTAVLEEIERLEGDYIKAHYGKLLLDKNLPATEIPNVISTLSNEINSDYYLSALLKDNIKKLLVTPEAANAFYKATEDISSDYYKSMVLKDALKSSTASLPQIKTILRSASTINSDYYLSVVLTSLLESKTLDNETLNEVIVTSKNISSDYYRTQVLEKALKNGSISNTSTKVVIDALSDVGSDYYKTSVFNSLAEKTQLDPSLQIDIANVLRNSVSSDYYASITITKILQNQKLNNESLQQLLQAAGSLNSSTYASNVFEEFAKKDLSSAQLIQILKATETIDSDHYLSSVLQRLAPQVKTADASVKDAYRHAAKSIDSETYYGRALKAIE
ncbi:hypothetical protein [Chryseosolibacter indicus]|uniref:HEAT repeat domain-containing protein n=1 Tax=Chryseosolibacter indicus TaxID=2782351 RepID=A0ABS5VU65_9BACT|nr:hypothetical protein [Chryseosolibacter indicus]MBT1704965.1 hypothetical protein [Chryseosolibacter indicus]